MSLRKNTREQLLQEAEVLFSSRGFNGTSIHDVAARVQISKQGLLHHFPSKEKLYASVLEGASNYLMEYLKSAKQSSDIPNQQLLAIFIGMTNANERLLVVIVLLLRELLDNPERLDEARKWYLRPFLDELVAIVKAGQNQGQFLGLSPLAYVYQLLGTSQYYLISQPTLSKIYSKRAYKDHQKQHKALLEKTIIEY